jgi:hypothetical protein
VTSRWFVAIQMRPIAITNEYEAKTIARLKEGVVEEPAHINSSWLAEKKWVVVPRESACHFDDAYADTLSAALTETQCPQLFALATEPLPLGNFFPISDAYAVQPSKDGLLAFSRDVRSLISS